MPGELLLYRLFHLPLHEGLHPLPLHGGALSAQPWGQQHPVSLQFKRTIHLQVLGHGALRVHTDVARSVDALLAGRRPATQLRRMVGARAVVRFEGAAAEPCAAGAERPGGGGAGAGQWMEDLLNLCRCKHQHCF